MPKKKRAAEAPSGGEGPGRASKPNAGGDGRGRGRGRGRGPSPAPGQSSGGRGRAVPPPGVGAPVLRPAGEVPNPVLGRPSDSTPPSEVVEASGMKVPEPGKGETGLGLSSQGTKQPEVQKPFEVPESLKGLGLLRRPGFGTKGQKVVVRTNYYLAKCNNDFVYQHDVTIKETPSRREGEVSSKGVRRAIMREVVLHHRASGLNNCLPAFDGNKILFTAKQLSQEINDFEIVLPEEDGRAGRERRFKVVIKAVVGGRIDLSRLLDQAYQRQYEIPQDAINALDTALRETPTFRDTPVGRSFFRPPHQNLVREAALGAGLEAWRGYYQSVRPTISGLALNLDLSTTAFYQAVDVLAYLREVMGRNWNSARPSTDADRLKMKKVLRQVKVEVTHNRESRRKYRVQDISRTSAAQTMFDLEGVGRVSVAQYFQQHYKFTLRFPNLPCIIAASNRAHLPLEVCRILGGQRFPRKLTDDQIRKMLRITQRRPPERERETQQSFEQNRYNEDEYAREFGISVDKKMMEVDSRILPPPDLVFQNQSRAVKPANGEWRQDRGAKFVEGITIHTWAVLNFGAVPDNVAAELSANLARRCNELGMNLNPHPMVPPRRVSEREASDIVLLRSVLQTLISDIHKQPHARGHPLQLVLCIFPQTSPGLYGYLKRLSVTELGFVTQGCLAKHVARPGPVYLGNLALKINVKVASEMPVKRIDCNFMLAPAMRSLFPPHGSTIIFGADVSHPGPGDDAPSIAAVVASQDWPFQGRYRAIVSTQEKHQEMIQSFFDNVKSHLTSFFIATGKIKPNHIIVYRDGVSEGQFMQVLLRELDAIQKACHDLDPDGSYRPLVTFVVVQKRHHTRFFPTTQFRDRSGNVPAGTVVDTGIVHPTQFDFFLNSHAGLLGTSRPTRYIVLYDENRFSADAMQMLSNALCYTYARCTRSVSIVPPVYYAHLAAAQARCFLDHDWQRQRKCVGLNGKRC